MGIYTQYFQMFKTCKARHELTSSEDKSKDTFWWTGSGNKERRAEYDAFILFLRSLSLALWLSFLANSDYPCLLSSAELAFLCCDCCDSSDPSPDLDLLLGGIYLLASNSGLSLWLLWLWKLFGSDNSGYPPVANLNKGQGRMTTFLFIPLLLSPFLVKGPRLPLKNWAIDPKCTMRFGRFG